MPNQFIRFTTTKRVILLICFLGTIEQTKTVIADLYQYQTKIHTKVALS